MQNNGNRNALRNALVTLPNVGNAFPGVSRERGAHAVLLVPKPGLAVGRADGVRLRNVGVLGLIDVQPEADGPAAVLRVLAGGHGDGGLGAVVGGGGDAAHLALELGSVSVPHA